MTTTIDDHGPWVGVPAERQSVCAVVGCEAKGKPQICPYDGHYHHHGCIHYADAAAGHGLTFRTDGWCYVCDTHHAVLVSAHSTRKVTP